jgi:hypothetical protein
MAAISDNLLDSLLEETIEATDEIKDNKEERGSFSYLATLFIKLVQIIVPIVLYVFEGRSFKI